MVRLFFVDCPDCGETFHAHYGELRHGDVPLLCPTCGSRFTVEESPRIQE